MDGKTNGVHGADARKHAVQLLRDFADQIEKETSADLEMTMSRDRKPTYNRIGLYDGSLLMGETLHVSLRWPGGKGE